MPVSQRVTAYGFAIVPEVLTNAECDALADHVAGAAASASASGGTRNLLQQDWCRTMADRLRRQPVLAPVLLAPGLVAVQCTYFEKSSARNWLVPVHQDLGIPVAKRVDHPGLSAWSEKEGALFVQPPAEVLQQLIAVRVHIDACTADDGPLRVIPGSHTLGKLDPQAAATTRQTQPEAVCVIERGGALLMRPLLLHASSKSSGTGQRRVLHLLFGPATLPLGLEWQDAV